MGESSNFRKSWAFIIGTVFSAIIVVLFLFSLIANAATKQDKLEQQHTGPMHHGRIALDFVYPKHLLHDSSPSYLIVGFAASSSQVFTRPMTLTFSLPPSIHISGTVSSGQEVEIVFLPENGRLQESRLLLQNSGTLLRSQQQTITPTTSLNHELNPFEIQIESPAKAAWRQFLHTVISDNSPLILTITILVPLISFLWQQSQKQQEKLQREQEKEVMELQDKTRLQIDNLRKCLGKGELVCVKEYWILLDHTLARKILGCHKYEQLKQRVELALKGVLVALSGE